VIWKHAHQEAMFAAAEAHEEYNVDTSARIDVFATIDSAEIDLAFKPIGAAGLYLPAKLFGANGIVVNSDHPLALQRYSASHELGHHHFGHEPDIDLEPELVARPDREQLPDEEKLAEAFASWFLAPPELVDIVLEQVGVERPWTPRDVYQLALRLGTSYKATCYHLPSLKLLDARVAHQWAQLELRKIKEEIATQQRPEGWHYDVWALGEHDRGVEHVVRAGDRLALELGGTWQVDLPRGFSLVGDEPTTLFPEKRDITVVDIARNAPRGAVTLTLRATNGDTFTVGLEVVRPCVGKYMPVAPAPANARPAEASS
jgi:Zn-dependent peptidase ImmA (M78 family)